MRCRTIILVLLLYISPAVTHAQLSGPKTIGGDTPDYANFTDAVNALNSQGISASVTFNVRTGTYNEQISLNQITGASESSTITFQSEDEHPDSVTLTYTASGSSDNYVVELNGADYITFRKMTISSGGTGYGRCVVLKDAARHNTIASNRINGQVVSGTSNNLALVMSVWGTTASDTNNYMENELANGAIGILCEGSSGNTHGTKITGNTFSGQSYQAVRLWYQDSVQVTGNRIESNVLSSAFYGISASYCYNKCIIKDNEIQKENNYGGNGISMGYCEGASGKEILIGNNFIRIHSVGYSQNGIVSDNNSYIKYYHNTVNLTGNSAGGKSMHIKNSHSQVEIKNNVIANQSGGHTIYNETTSGITSDFNDLYATGPQFAYWGEETTDLSSWRSVSGQGMNSISVDPYFFSNSNLHTANTGLQSGTPLSSDIPDDIDGEARDLSAPCMGADEFVYPALGGAYTIGSSGDYPDFTNAVQALIDGGLRGAVTFNVEDGTYTEQITIPAIVNSSGINTVTFQSASGDSSLAILTYSPGGSGDNFTVRLDEARHLAFRNLTFQSEGTDYATIFDIRGSSGNLEFAGNRFIGTQYASVIEGYLMNGTTDWVGDSIEISDNLFRYGSNAVYLQGQSGEYAKGFILENNECLDQLSYGIRLRYSIAPVVRNNRCITGTTQTYSGLVLYYGDDALLVDKNRVVAGSSKECYAIYLFSCDGQPGKEGIVSNNYVRTNIESTGTYGQGIYVRSSNYTKVLNNTVEITGNQITSKSIYIRSTSSDIEVYNNILMNSANGYSFYADQTTGISSDYNDLYTSGDTLGFWNLAGRSDLAAWRSASGLDANSLSIDPGLPSAGDPHFPDPLLNDAGTPLSEVTDDIDGEMRDATAPDIGADEFCLPPVANDASGCTTRSIPPLTATGSGIKWYADRALTSMLAAGNSFSTGQTAAGSYKYYVTQTINESESRADSATLTIKTTPAIPPASDSVICEYEPTPDFTATGTDLKWYSDPGLTNQVGSGTSYASGISGAVDTAFYVTQTTDGCESDADTSRLTIHPQPDPPAGDISVSCFGENVPDLYVSGENIQWYEDEALNTPVHTGNTYSTGDTLAGYYYYYPTQTVSGCESEAGYDTLRIKPRPDAPVADSQAVCYGESVPDLTAAGSSINWYADAGRSTLLGSGNSYATGETEVGIYPYYATQTADGCESLNKQLALAINPVPDPAVLEDQEICEADSRDFHLGTAENTAHSYSWTSSQGDLASAQADPVVHPVVPETYKYYLTETIDSTGCDKSDSVTIVIHPNPVVGITAVRNPIDRGSNTSLNASGADSYVWSPAGGLSGTTGAQVTASPNENTTYILVGTNQYGCTGRDSIDLFVYCPACGQETYFEASGTFSFGCTNNLYRNNLDCSWTLLPTGVDSIYLSFDEPFDIKAGDFVRVYNGSDATAPLIGQYNNDGPPPALVRSGNSMFIRFTTNDTITGTGFQAEWSNEPVSGINALTLRDIEIYPNPASQTVTIEFHSTAREKTSVSFYSETGQLIRVHQFISEPGSVRQEFNVKEWKAGIYFIRIVKEDRVINRKFIKE